MRSDLTERKRNSWSGEESFEAQRGLFSKFLSLQLFRHELHTCFAQYEADSALSLLV